MTFYYCLCFVIFLELSRIFTSWQLLLHWIRFEFLVSLQAQWVSFQYANQNYLYGKDSFSYFRGKVFKFYINILFIMIIGYQKGYEVLEDYIKMYVHYMSIQLISWWIHCWQLLKMSVGFLDFFLILNLLCFQDQLIFKKTFDVKQGCRWRT